MIKFKSRTKDEIIEFVVSCSAIVLTAIGVVLSSLDIYPAFVIVFAVCNVAWLYLGIRWRKYPIIINNIMLMVVSIGGMIIKHLYLR